MEKVKGKHSSLGIDVILGHWISVEMLLSKLEKTPFQSDHLLGCCLIFYGNKLLGNTDLLPD